MRLSPRYTIALMLTVMYLVITVSPLAPLALRSKVIAHAVTGECSGDCDICGCSPEQRANHTCCCWRKKLQHDHEHESKASCCKKKLPGGSKPILACGCPCGNGKQLAFSGAAKIELLLHHFAEDIYTPQESSRFSHSVLRVASRLGEPPEPPPRLSSFS